MKKAVILLSGGIDSATAMAVAKAEGFDTYALSFDYGQRHAIELLAAKAVAKQLGAKEHLVIKVDLHSIGGSALTSGLRVPKDRLMTDGTIPPTYVPARNTVFLALALAWAEVLEVEDIFIGVNIMDYSGYPDCRPDYIEAFQGMANLATKAGVEGRLSVRIQTPLIGMTKAQIIRKGIELGLDYSVTSSCYDPSPQGLSCGHCDSCIIRRKGFREAGIEDPTRYSKDFA
jgi:7-cyano-7-deazaguanine synthase